MIELKQVWHTNIIFEVTHEEKKLTYNKNDNNNNNSQARFQKKKKKIVEFSPKGLPPPPLVEKIIKYKNT